MAIRAMNEEREALEKRLKAQEESRKKNQEYLDGLQSSQ